MNFGQPSGKSLKSLDILREGLDKLRGIQRVNIFHFFTNEEFMDFTEILSIYLNPINN